jgi:hypothetical protein
MDPSKPMKPLRRPMRRAVRAAAGLTLGVVAMLPFASSSEAWTAAPVVFGAGPGAADAGVSALVANAQRSQVVPPDIGDLERMCALLTSCDRLPIPPSLIPDDFTSCVKKMGDELTSARAINFSLTMRECGLKEASCAGLRACAMHGASGDACIGRGKQSVVSVCDVDGRALTCWHDQTLSVRDCPRGGEQCVVVGGQATCTLGPCSGGVVEGDKPRCSASATHLVHCEKGKLASLDCAAFGLKCSTAKDGTAGCATSGPPCSEGDRRCDGSVAVGCVNGHEVRVDCTATGLTCSQSPVTGTPVGACVAAPPANDACDPGDKARCDDASIKYCYAGKARSYSCKSAGFGRCDSSKNGLRCVP